MNPPVPHPPRHARIPKQKRGPEGEPLCRHCEGPVPKGRRTFCSKECVEQAMVRSDPGWARKAVWKRDRGICAICGRNSVKDFKQFNERYQEARKVATWLEMSCRLRFCKIERVWIRPVTEGMGWEARKKERRRIISNLIGDTGGWTPGRSTGWDCDHIHEVVRGGGSCGIENLQTLCVPCHRKKTARLAAERAAERNPKPAALSVQMPLL